MSNSPQQLSLGVSLNDDATFDNFYTVSQSKNAQAVAVVKDFFADDAERFLYLWGSSGVGLTHLLQAACHQAEEQGYTMQYLPLQDMVGFSPEQLFEGLESLDLVCLDGLQCVAGHQAWELALFNLFNRLRDAGKRLLVAAEQGPHQLPVDLPDFRSRLNWGVSFQLQALNDDEKLLALQLRAKARGLLLSDDVAQFIVSRAPRNMNELFLCLNRLDDASLAEQRKLTIPFVKKILNL